jgi:hypothetical protein
VYIEILFCIFLIHINFFNIKIEGRQFVFCKRIFSNHRERHIHSFFFNITDVGNEIFSIKFFYCTDDTFDRVTCEEYLACFNAIFGENV